MTHQEMGQKISQLAPRQKEVLFAMLQGQTDAAIAQTLGIGESTVRQYIARLCQTFRIDSMGERRSKRPDLVALFARTMPELLQGQGHKIIDPQQTLPSKLDPEPGEGNSGATRPQTYYLSVPSVSRPKIESVCQGFMLEPGALVKIKGPRGSGKTSLVATVLSKLAQQNFRTANLSLKLADRDHFRSLDKFLRWLCANLTHQLQLTDRLSQFWNEDSIGSKMSCTIYFQDYLLPAQSPLILFLDDIDTVVPHEDICDDFLGLLRSWHDVAMINPIWSQLRLIIAHSTDIALYIKSIPQSPFDNVGKTLELSEFTIDEVGHLANIFGLNLTSAQLDDIFRLTGGLPDLLQTLLAYLRSHQESDVEAVIASAATEWGIYSHQLRQHWLTLEDHPSLWNTFRRVIQADSSVKFTADPSFYQLQMMGLVKVKDHAVVPRCELYRVYFAKQMKGSDAVRT